MTWTWKRPFPRLRRGITKLLGPSCNPNTTLPPPTPTPLTANLTFGHYTPLQNSSPDASIQNLKHKSRIHYALIPFIAIWLTGFVLFVRQQWYSSTTTTIGCTSSIWSDWPADICGVNATYCEGNLEGGSEVYRCLGGCDLVTLGNPRWVGGEEINGVPVVIGPSTSGDNVYRADSWICAAGIHAGIISSTFGGSLTLTPLAFPSQTSNYTSTTSHGLTSTPFLPSYPGAYSLTPSSETAIDLHYPLLAYNVICLFLTTLLLSLPHWLLFSLQVVIGYLQIKLFSDVSDLTPDWSGIIGGFPAIAFTSYWIWKVSFQSAYSGFRELPMEHAIWSGLGYWIGIESSTIFARLPISRLGYGGLSPSGIVEITIIIIIVVIVVLLQAYEFRKQGLLRYYLIRYLPLVPLCIILANLGHGYVLRPHHYILGLLAIPVLSLPNRISVVGGGFCLGLFIDGIGRWGWDSLVQSTGSLLGDAASGTGQPIFNTTLSLPSILSWTSLTPEMISNGITAFSLLVDDIQWTANYTLSNISITDLGFSRDTEHYLRIAYIANGTSQDYTDPVIWSPSSANWTGPGLA